MYCPVIAVLASLYIATYAQTGVYTDSICSCSEFAASSGSECVKTSPTNTGMCTMEQCGPGYKCDMESSTLCNRKKCTVMQSINLGTSTSMTPGSEFPCESTEVPCAEHTETITLAAPTDPSGCHFTDAECSCSAVSSSDEGQCVRLNVLGDQDTSSRCTMGQCTGGYKCDCAGTEMCDRVSCQSWAVSENNPGGPTSPEFNCIQVDNKCVQKKN